MKITIEGKPGTGKTTLACNIAKMLASDHTSVKYLVPEYKALSNIDLDKLYPYVPSFIEVVHLPTNKITNKDLIILDEIGDKNIPLCVGCEISKTVIIVKRER